MALPGNPEVDRAQAGTGPFPSKRSNRGPIVSCRDLHSPQLPVLRIYNRLHTRSFVLPPSVTAYSAVSGLTAQNRVPTSGHGPVLPEFALGSRAGEVSPDTLHERERAKGSRQSFNCALAALRTVPQFKHWPREQPFASREAFGKRINFAGRVVERKPGVLPRPTECLPEGSGTWGYPAFTWNNRFAQRQRQHELLAFRAQAHHALQSVAAQLQGHLESASRRLFAAQDTSHAFGHLERSVTPVEVIYRQAQPVVSQSAFTKDKRVDPVSTLPKIDVDQLSRDVQRQIEKRIRFERQCRGLL